jgi:hypothetical protein
LSRLAGLLVHGRESRALTGELRHVVVVVEGSAEVDDPEQDQEEWEGDERELDERRPALVAAEQAQAPARLRKPLQSVARYRATPEYSLSHTNVLP